MNIVGIFLLIFAGIDIIGGSLASLSAQSSGKAPAYVNSLPSGLFPGLYKVPYLNFLLIGLGVLLISLHGPVMGRFMKRR